MASESKKEKMIRGNYDGGRREEKRALVAHMRERLAEKYQHTLSVKQFQTMWSDIKMKSSELVDELRRNINRSAACQRQRRQQLDWTHSPPALTSPPPMSSSQDCPPELEGGSSASGGASPVPAAATPIRRGRERSRRRYFCSRSSFSVMDQPSRRHLADPRVSELMMELQEQKRRLEVEGKKNEALQKKLEKMDEEHKKDMDTLKAQVLEYKEEVVTLNERFFQLTGTFTR